MNGKTRKQARTAKGIQHRIDSGCRQRIIARIDAREMRKGY